MTTSVTPTRDKIELRHRGYYTTADRTLHNRHNAGFFSNCSVALWNLSELQTHHGVWPDRLDFSQAFSSYRNSAQAAEATDLYPVLFKAGAPGESAHTARGRIPYINHHGFYRFLDYAGIAPAMQRYFQPSARAMALASELTAKHGIDPGKTIAVVYRGTDKGIEVRLAQPQAYLVQARKLIAAHPTHRVWIQTDEAAVRDLFVSELGDRCFFLPEMPVSSNAKVVHDLDDEALRLDRSEFGVLLVAVAHLLSRCDFIVNHTGNMALWICLFRGHGRRVVQFGEAGALVNFLSLDFYIQESKLAWSKLQRRFQPTAAKAG